MFLAEHLNAELLVNIAPLTMVFDNDFEQIILTRCAPPTTSNNRIVLDELNIAAHRLFGPVGRSCLA